MRIARDAGVVVEQLGSVVGGVRGSFPPIPNPSPPAAPGGASPTYRRHVGESLAPNNYVKAGGEMFVFDDRDPDAAASAVVFCEERSRRGNPKGATWRAWKGMPDWIREVGDAGKDLRWTRKRLRG